MIREAREEDLGRLVEMGERFRRETKYAQYLAANPARMRELAVKLLEGGGLLLSEREGRVVGMLGSILHDHFISGERMTGEVFWWVEPECRTEGVKLLREMERRATERGATISQMIAPTEKVARFYEKLGYSYVESTYQRTLCSPA